MGADDGGSDNVNHRGSDDGKTLPMPKKQRRQTSVATEDVKHDDEEDNNDGVDKTDNHSPQPSSTVSPPLPSSSSSVVNDYRGFSFQPPNYDARVADDDGSSSTTKLSVDVISAVEATGPRFFRDYISRRKPCVLDPSLSAAIADVVVAGGHNPVASNGGTTTTTTTTATTCTPIIRITKQILLDVAGDEVVQVERRHSLEENFGQNRTSLRQVMMTVRDFLSRVTTGDGKGTKADDTDTEDGPDETGGDDKALYYLSTQERTDDDDDDGDDPYASVPCRQLVDGNHVPRTLPAAGRLVLASCNLWMGGSNGSSSGLHHDYHDNFYVLLKGKKRFRLLSPDCAPLLATYGTVTKVHPNGTISYVGDEKRADGTATLGTAASSDPLGTGDDDNDEEEEEDDDDEDEVVIGKGFDYVSDEEDGSDGGDGATFEEGTDQKDDFDEIMGTEEDGEDDAAGEGRRDAETETNVVGACKHSIDENDEDDDGGKRPNSFSRIDPCRTDREALNAEFPSFACCVQVMVELEAGQILYLPAGWFHEVTSYGTSEAGRKKLNGEEQDGRYKDDDDGLGQCHMALNYWYHPPDALENYDHPYQDDFWKKEEQVRLGTKKKHPK